MSDAVSGACSFHVRPHPAATRRPDGGFIDGALSIGGQFGVDRDLDAGDELTVTIASADGEVLAQGVVEVQGVAFKPVKVKGFVIGTTRVHKAKLT